MSDLITQTDIFMGTLFWLIYLEKTITDIICPNVHFQKDQAESVTD